jgi:hypothetical protein
VEYADLSVSQARGDMPWVEIDAPFPTPVRSIGWSVTGRDLHGHILGARLVDTRPGGGTLLELPRQPIAGGTAALAGELLDTPGSRRDAGSKARPSRARLSFVMATEQETAFPTLKPEELTALAARGHSRAVRSGEYLFRAGDRNFCF